MDNTGLGEKILEWRRELDIAPRQELIKFSKLKPLDQNTPGSNRPLRPSHYELPIDPYEYCLRNCLGGLEMNVIKYVTRWKNKDGIRDLEKAIDTLNRLIEWQKRQNNITNTEVYT